MTSGEEIQGLGVGEVALFVVVVDDCNYVRVESDEQDGHKDDKSKDGYR